MQPLSHQLLRLAVPSPQMASPCPLGLLPSSSKSLLVPPPFPTGAPPVGLTLPPQAQPRQLGSEGERKVLAITTKAGKTHLDAHTHTFTPKFPYQEQDKALKCPF